MTLITLQQDFLPTDTVSTLAQEPSNMVFAWVGVLLLLLATVIVITGVGADSTSVIIVGLALAIIGIVLFFGSRVATTTATAEFNESVKAATVKDTSNFVSNIEAVYDVEVTLPEDDDYSVTPEENRSVKVVQDEVAYEALVSQDPDTYEPTLIMVASAASDIQEFRKK